MCAWAPRQRVPLDPTQNMTHIQDLVRKAKVYPPERETRLVHDVFNCCRQFNGLKPKLEPCTFDSGRSLHLLALDGVIPITYRGVNYQIPVMILCRPHYPDEAPVPYVRPTPSMVIREGHANVDRSGRVFLQYYLQVWSPEFSLYGLSNEMRRVFSSHPPVNARPTNTRPVQPASSRPTPTPSQPSTPTVSASVTPTATAAADAVERASLISKLSQRLSERLDEVGNDATEDLGRYMHRRESITAQLTETSGVSKKHKEYKELCDTYEELSKRREELSEWVTAMGDKIKERDVDVLLQFEDIILHQYTECMAEDNALNDTLDQADEALVKGVIDHDKYVKDVRNLAREQFFPRALSKRLNSEYLRSNKRTERSGVQLEHTL